MIENIPVDRLKISEFNIRTITDSEEERKELEKLKRTIQSVGIIEPLIVRKKEESYEVVVGQRRFLACKELGISSIPCIIKDLTDQEALEYSLIENLQRKDVDPIDIAEGLKRLYDEIGKSLPNLSLRKFSEMISKKIGLSDRQVRSYLALLGLTPELQQMVSEGKLTIESGAKLKQLPEDKQREFAEEFSKVLEEKPITQDEEEEIINEVREHPERIEEIMEEKRSEGRFVKITIRCRLYKEEFKMKESDFVILEKKATALRLNVGELIQNIILEKIKEWGDEIARDKNRREGL